MTSAFLKLGSKTRFRLRLELYAVGFGFFASQALLVSMPALDLVVTLLVLLYLMAVDKELKTRRESFTPKQKQVLFGLPAFACGAVLAALFFAGLVKRTPLVWIAFGLAAVLSLALLFHEYEQLYKDGDSA